MNENEKNRIRRLFEENEYGKMPLPPTSVEGSVQETDARFSASKATLEKIFITAKAPAGEVKFPFTYCYQNGKTAQKTVICINFRPEIPDRYIPAEEIIDMGWNFAAFNYLDIAPDSGEENENTKILASGLSPAPGRLMIWAWAASRILDYLGTRPETDIRKTGVAGHSRLGKTALIAGAFDERFAFVHSNDSGCSGAALLKMVNADSECIEFISRVFPFWFCPKFRDYAGKETEMPFDQDSLLALIAPRPLSVGSAALDLWANPPAEMECARRAGKAWEAFGKPGLIAPSIAEIGKAYGEGTVLYYCRPGTHYFSREDWKTFLPFFEEHLK